MSIFNWMLQAPLTFFVFTIIIVSGLAIQSLEDYNPEDMTKALDKSYENVSKLFQIKEENTKVVNIMYKIMDTTIYTGFEAGKIGAGWAYENREWINFKLIVWLFLLAIISCFIVPITKFSIIIFIISKEYLQNKREKKELSKLEIKKILRRKK